MRQLSDSGLGAIPRSAAFAATMLLLAQFGSGAPRVSAPQRVEDASARELLTVEQWKALDAATDRGLEYLSKRQQQNGAFEGPAHGQPGITSLCVLAFLSRGHVPRDGIYGKQIDRAVDFVLSCQQKDGYLFNRAIDHTDEGTYNHAIAGLMLGEVYGMTRAEQRDRVRSAILKGLEFTRAQQLLPKSTTDNGGWRYVKPPGGSDLSVTCWHVMFMRSARNAEFEVPKEYIDEAMAYVRRTFSPKTGTFGYMVSRPSNSRAMAGGGILMLELGGEHQSEMARSAGDWILRSSFDRYNNSTGGMDRYHYGAYYCSQAMFQLGGEYWAKFYPRLMNALLKHQHSNGSWDRESIEDAEYGNGYTTALSILALTPPYQILPIYQR